MLHSPHICFALRCHHLSQYSLHCGYSTCYCICFANIILYMSEMYCPIFRLCSILPSVLQNLRSSIVRLRCLIRHMASYIIAIVTLMSVDITCFQVTTHKFSCGPSRPTCRGDGIALVIFVIFVFVIPTTHCVSDVHFVFNSIVVYWDVWVSTSDLMFFKHHFPNQIVKKYSTVNRRCFHAYDRSRCWVLCLLDLMFEWNKSAFIHPVLVALWQYVPGIHQECIHVCNTRQG